jgi:type II secretory pathway pseudopilin PulG
MRIRRRSIHGGKDSGYMLLLLMLAVAVLTITMLGVARSYKRAVQRDREVEMIHRGEQYERAVRRFYIKNSRYPVSLEQLENMNKTSYLRKRYKDPMSPDGEWKLVHATDVKLTATGAQPVTTGTGTQPADGSQPGTQTGSQTGQDTGSSSTGGNAGAGNTTGGGATTGNNSGSAFGNSGSSGTGNSGSAFGNSGTSGGGTGSGIGNSTQGSSAFGNSSGAGNAANGQVLGGGDVYGVVSKSKKEGFHIYGEKGKYNEWFFIYDPSMDKGQLLVGPYNPKMFVGTANSGLGSGTGTTGTGAPGSGLSGGTGTSNTPGGSTTGTPTPQQPSQPAQPNQ